MTASCTCLTAQLFSWGPQLLLVTSVLLFGDLSDFTSMNYTFAGNVWYLKCFNFHCILGPRLFSLEIPVGFNTIDRSEGESVALVQGLVTLSV